MNTSHDNGVLPSQPFTTPMPKVKPSRMEITISDPASIREIAERAYEAGCQAMEYHREDCQAETDEIIRDVLSRPLPERLRAITTKDAVEIREIEDREAAIERFVDLLGAAASSSVRKAHEVVVENRMVSIDMRGAGLRRLRIPAWILYGADPRLAGAIVDSYIDAYRAGHQIGRMTPDDLTKICRLLAWGAERLVEDGADPESNRIKDMYALGGQALMEAKRLT